MITIAMLTTILPIIAIGGAFAIYYAVDHAGRAESRKQELADIDAWLDQIRNIR